MAENRGFNLLVKNLGKILGPTLGQTPPPPSPTKKLSVFCEILIDNNFLGILTNGIVKTTQNEICTNKKPR